MENKESSFSYNYSAAQQQEIKRIREKYLPQGEDKMERLRRLHSSATNKAQMWALTIGILGALIMGTGMSLAMTDLSTILGMDGGLAMVIGVAVGLLGMVLVTLAYPAYNRVLRKTREKIAPEILRLTDELMK